MKKGLSRPAEAFRRGAGNPFSIFRLRWILSDKEPGFRKITV